MIKSYLNLKGLQDSFKSQFSFGFVGVFFKNVVSFISRNYKLITDFIGNKISFLITYK